MRVLACSLAAALLLAGVAAQEAQQCVGVATTVTLANGKPAAGVAKTAYDKSGVQQHFDTLEPFSDFRPDTGSTFSCVDSRAEVDSLGTPGGDIAELAGGIAIYMNQTGTKFSEKAVADILNAFMDAVATKDRPFYLHTSDEKLNKVFHIVEEAGVTPKPTVFPDTMPTDKKVADIWLNALTNGSNQGCGHMRLMIEKYADFGLATPDVPKALIKAFFQYWWPTPVRSEQRAKSRLTVVQGPLNGNAVAIIDDDGGCPGHAPAIPPSHGGSQLFIYHATAVEAFREQVLTPFFVSYATKNGKTVDKTKFYNSLKVLQAKQLKSVLDLLPPANALPVWAVTIKTEKPAAADAAAADAAPAADAAAAVPAADAAAAAPAKAAPMTDAKGQPMAEEKPAAAPAAASPAAKDAAPAAAAPAKP